MSQGALSAQMVRFKVLEPLAHSVLGHADLAGQHAAVGDAVPNLTVTLLAQHDHADL